MKYILPLLLAAPLFLEGCSVVDKNLYKKEVVAVQSVTVPANIANPAIPAIPATENGIATNSPIVSAPVVSAPVSPQFVTNLVSNPKVEAAIEVVSVLPIPYSGLIGGVLALLYSTYRNIRNKKNIESLVLGVEGVRTLIKETPELQHLDQKVVKILKNNQKSLNTITEVSKIVAKLTDKKDGTVQHLD